MKRYLSDGTNHRARAWPSRAPSAAGYGIDVLDRPREGHRLPGVTPIAGTEDLAVITRANIDLLRVSGVKADRHNSPVHLHLVETLPARAGVAA